MISIKKKGEVQSSYGFPFLGPMSHPLTVPVDVSALTLAEVDAFGNLKPSVPLKKDGTLCSGAANEYVYGSTIEPIKIVDPNPTLASLQADTRTVLVTVGTIGIYLLDVAEDNLGRPLNANELAAFVRGGCHLVLSRT